MSTRMLVELPSGHKVIFGGAGTETGLAEVGLAADFAAASGDKFKAALGALADLVGALEASVDSMARRPDKFEMEFGAKLSSSCDLWIVSGDGEAEFKVKLTWGKGE